MKYQRSLFIFRRDLRVFDNTALEAASRQSQEVVPLFIVDPRQYQEHVYRSEYGLLFLVDCLNDLNAQLQEQGSHLYLCEGIADIVIGRLIDQLRPQAVFVNQDYTPFSIKRDLLIKTICQEKGVDFHSYEDALLHSPAAIKKKDGQGVYTVFTPFYKRCLTYPVRSVNSRLVTNFYKGKLPLANPELLGQMKATVNVKPSFKGGRQQGLGILSRLKGFDKYDKERDIPILDATTHLSAHHKFGSVSIRETYTAVMKAFGMEHTLIRELHWRDFFTHIAYHFPHVFGHAFYPQYDALKWSDDREHFERWCLGQTGFPIIDAGMRQLNQTGFMHNRVRMMVGSFLVKDLHLDWRWGERYFATKLIDYDPCVNNGNWQWVASTGCDHQPYYRIFNPWRQQERFDQDCRYIKKWVGELASVNAKSIHQWHLQEQLSHQLKYPLPMVDHQQQVIKTKLLFQSMK